MLPKRVSVLDTTLQQTNTARRGDDEDDLDYVENPFNEGRK